MRRAAPALALFAVAMLAPHPARATPPDIFGLGARTQAMGMTGVSYADDYEAVYANPAGLGRARRRGLHIGLSAGAYHLTIDGERDPLDSARGMTIGATLPLPFHDVLQDRLTFGVGVYTPQQVLLRGQVFYADVPQWSVLDRAQSLAIMVGMGFDFHSTDLEGLRLGLGVAALADVIGSLDVRLDETSRFTSTVETQLLATFSPIAGIQYERDQWAAGIVYRHEVRSEMNLDIATADLPVMLPVLTVGGLVQYDPAQVAGEIAFRPDPNLRLVANLTVRLWSFWPGPQFPTTASSLLAPAPAFQDTVSPRVAVEGTVRGGPVTMTVRGGYSLELSPAPPARLAPRRTPQGDVLMEGGSVVNMPVRYLDNDRHILTAGLGLVYDLSATERIRLDLFAQAHLLVDRTHTIPAPGNTSTDMGDWMKTGGFLLAGGWTITLEF